jgi:DNA-binding transcriptional ArsR family regulator
MTTHSLQKSSTPSSTKAIYIDSRRFSRYFFFIMSSTKVSLDRALHAIADPTRRRILQALKEGEAEARTTGHNAGSMSPCLCAGDIEERVRLSQPTISHHMGILTKAGLVAATKKGQWRWYRRNEKAIRAMVKTLRGKL